MNRHERRVQAAQERRHDVELQHECAQVEDDPRVIAAMVEEANARAAASRARHEHRRAVLERLRKHIDGVLYERHDDNTCGQCTPDLDGHHCCQVCECLEQTADAYEKIWQEFAEWGLEEGDLKTRWTKDGYVR